jgi:hypothetical protein
VNLPARHKQFFGNLRAALAPSGRRLPLELSLDRVPPGRLADSALLHICLLAAAFLLPRVRPAAPVVLEQKLPDSTVIYYPAQFLPETHDAGGSARGSQGVAGGRAAFHARQRIHIARAIPLNDIVTDGPKLQLPTVPGAAANLLALPATPAAVPMLKAPVELARRTSKIERPEHSRTNDADPSSSTLQLKLQRSRAQLPSSMVVVEPPANVALASPVVLPRPRPVLPKEVATEAVNSAPGQLRTVPLKAVPAVAEAEIHGNASAEVRAEVVISAKPGAVIGVPAEGKAGSLAVTPKGSTQPGIGNEGRGASIARGPGTGSSSSGGWTGRGAAASGPGSNPVAKEGVSPDSGHSGAGNGNASTTPGVDIRGGVVTLGSFGPKAAPGGPSGSAPARKQSAITIVATSRSGGGLPAYGVFKNRTVYTVYVDTTAGEAVLQFAAQGSTAVDPAGLTPPDPLNTQVPRGIAGASVVFACVLDESGHLQNLRVISGSSPTPALEEAVRRWIFHPALNGGQAIAVDALIGIGIGVQ